jgi:hypothetical protein
MLNINKITTVINLTYILIGLFYLIVGPVTIIFTSLTNNFFQKILQFFYLTPQTSDFFIHLNLAYNLMDFGLGNKHIIAKLFENQK